MKHTRAHAPMQLGLRLFQRRLRRTLVATGNRELDIFDMRPDAADACTVDYGAAGVTPDTFFCRCVIGHLRDQSVYRKGRKAGVIAAGPAAVKRPGRRLPAVWRRPT